MKKQTKKKRSGRIPLLFSWAGSKARLMRKLVPLFPSHVCYVSLFGGAGGDICNKPRSKVEVYNDLNLDVTNLFRLLRSKKRRKELCYRLLHTPYSRLQFAKCVTLLKSTEKDSLERAWAFVYCTQTQASKAAPGICTKSSFGVPKKGGLRSEWFNVVTRIERNARRFREVIIENLQWQDVLRRYDSPETLFYADPPYLLSTRQGRKYRHEMSAEEHEGLLEALRRVEGYVVLSGYDSQLYRERLGDWRRTEFEVYCCSSPAEKKPIHTEVVWMNFQKYGQRIPGLTEAYEQSL